MTRLLSVAAALVFLLTAGCATRPAAENSAAPAATGPAASAESTAGPSGKSFIDDDDDDWDDVAEVKVFDPIEPVNRGLFWFNHQLYTYVAKPFSTAYKFVLPEPVRLGVRNVFDNLRFPGRFVNHTLQGRLDRTALETGKFVVNTTAGVGGIMKPSEKIPAMAELPRVDTGQTLAKWGVPHGPYVVLPVLGPHTAREVVGTAGDTALNPVSWLAFIFPGAGWTVGVSAPSGAHGVPDQMDTYDAATRDALDPYISARTGYIQYRNAAASR
jgi:phospholipid-binding lipoprotein MlaA